ncbi:tRNA uridine-5-carboxymethylaminomethyl(34) synthesis GTPase MnmE [Phenylobacterium sp.]|jgi:tRNA modification GTPase|uniref:tRNA uridine-5-carboxymethylaminomethyl(34) synthesis GTPase MnmE n=1 Tax=Phenylobacterium sp. TaxID=1871053 RepID=UPI002E32E7D3|nr:tRNA uridine-5-carboxymethylaminomethyl(34) synthesis GTPase MnmE [Phenylobacterium sp.]HEX3366280.1 tRNA uridine-5-carboxymethylaminomethyl(34) synthesis GTPase MnmE [Phenylobacterium sp.]
MSDTIFAPATAAGRAAVAVVRLSGPRTRAAVRALAGRLPAARRASLRALADAQGVPIDEALVLWFPAPGSYTGEDSAEFHVHGGPAVVSALVDALAAQGLRLAEPGEFTRRAFEHGKLDLAQAEGVADLVDAETEAQRRQALAQLGGRLSGVQARWRDGLIRASAMLEAAVDFPDEEVPADVAGRARPILEILADELEAAAADVARGEQVREGFRIALLGSPNAGKSTLLNVLARREAAIVSATPGTTRDIIEVPMVLGGYKVIVADTAGLRVTTDEIEAEGVRRAEAWAETAGLRVWLVDGYGDPDPVMPASLRSGDIVLLTKRDLGEGLEGLPGEPFTARSPNDVAWLERSLTETVVEALGGSELPAATRLRHRDLLTEAAARLRQALSQDESLELAAEDVRLAARALDRITGRIDPEDVLGRIFATFCIGK